MSDSDDELGAAPYFRLTGRVGSESVSAVWSNGFLTADAGLFERAELLIGLGETFVGDDPAREIRAGLDSPFVAALTLIRCFDRIVKAEIAFEADEHEAVARVASLFGVETVPARHGRTGPPARR